MTFTSKLFIFRGRCCSVYPDLLIQFILVFLREQIKDPCFFVSFFKGFFGSVQNYSRSVCSTAPSVSRTFSPCTLAHHLYLQNVNVPHCQKPLLWSVKKFPCTAARFCVIRHCTSANLMWLGKSAWPGEGERELGTEGQSRAGVRWGAKAYGSCWKKREMWTLTKRKKIAQGFGGRSVRERDRDFNGKVEKVIKKRRGQVRRRDVNRMRWKKGVREERDVWIGGMRRRERWRADI